MKLFAIVLGGLAQGSIIEVHDIRFALAEKIEDTYDILRATWWGIPKTLHIDCYGELTSTTDGYAITLSPDKPPGSDKLYFVNLGGYDPAEFGEAHRNVFVGAPNKAEAKRTALALTSGWGKMHKDFVYEVEDAFCLNDIAQGSGLHIHLTRAERVAPFTFWQGYRPI